MFTIRYILVSVVFLGVPDLADAAVFEFGWGVKLGFTPDPQMAAQRHEAKMMRMQVQHEQRMARYSRPSVNYYRAPSYSRGYGYGGGTIYYQGRTVQYGAPRVYYYEQRGPVRYYR